MGLVYAMLAMALSSKSTHTGSYEHEVVGLRLTLTLVHVNTFLPMGIY